MRPWTILIVQETGPSVSDEHKVAIGNYMAQRYEEMTIRENNRINALISKFKAATRGVLNTHYTTDRTYENSPAELPEQEWLCTFDSTHLGGAEMDNPYKHLQNAFPEPLPETPKSSLSVDSTVPDSFGDPLPDSFTQDRYAWLDTDKFVEKKLKEQEENKEKPEGKEHDDHITYDNDSLGG